MAWLVVRRDGKMYDAITVIDNAERRAAYAAEARALDSLTADLIRFREVAIEERKNSNG